MVGTVSNIIFTKKFGFISGNNGQEYFFHMEDMLGSWDALVDDFSTKGGGKVRVEFDAVKTVKGPRAKNVNVISGE